MYCYFEKGYWRQSDRVARERSWPFDVVVFFIVFIIECSLCIGRSSDSVGRLNETVAKKSTWRSIDFLLFLLFFIFFFFFYVVFDASNGE